jgi:hypothetical protein
VVLSPTPMYELALLNGVLAAAIVDCTMKLRPASVTGILIYLLCLGGDEFADVFTD